MDLVRAYEVPDGVGRDRPFVRANMISSIDGSITVGGRSGRLGGPADRNLFMLLRSLADVVLVGAGTARAERYGPARLSADHRARRVERGQAPVPVLAVVTASGQLDWASPFFTEAEVRPIVFTASGGDERNRAEAEAVADVVPA
ncbi:MAG TPA: dihydrofolate reductase family protein, partial [Acidimicrobiales bacterium]|nr:dihydrofolate reductase family protein [Acidimicrobiales bacterium]